MQQLEVLSMFISKVSSGTDFRSCLDTIRFNKIWYWETNFETVKIVTLYELKIVKKILGVLRKSLPKVQPGLPGKVQEQIATNGWLFKEQILISKQRILVQ